MQPTVEIDLLGRVSASSAPSGGWGYHAGQAAHLEPSCLGVLALATDADRYAAAIAGGWAAIESHAQPDGTYRLTRGRPQAAWPTAITLFTKTRFGLHAEATRDRLLTLEGRIIKADPEVAEMTDIDVGLLGWPWAEDTFSWVEPTAWACLALRAAGKGDHPRVREGLRLLIDRAFDTGGANYGNRITLGRATDPIPGPTAMMLLAVQGVADEPRIDAAKGYLRVQASQTTDLEHLAWIRIALSCHADDDATREIVASMESTIGDAVRFELTETNGLGAGPFRLALAALALDIDRRNPFHLTDPAQVATGNKLKAAPAADVDTPPPAAPGGFLGRIRAKLQGRMLNGLANMRALPVTSGVQIALSETYDAQFADIFQKQFEHFRQFLPITGKRVVLKPNLVEFHPDRVINTNPRFVNGVIEFFMREGAAEIIVAEGPGHWRNAQFLVTESGLGAVLRKHGVRFVDINHDEPVKMPNLGRLTGLEYLYLSKTVAEADVFVSLPKLKTHHWAGATLSMKNLFGTLPGICYGWPKNELHWRGIPQSIVDIALTRTPHLAIVDGVIGMEGDGPINGTPKPVGAVVMGMDLVAVDATCCRLMHLPPERIPTVMLAEQKRLGHAAEARDSSIRRADCEPGHPVRNATHDRKAAPASSHCPGVNDAAAGKIRRPRVRSSVLLREHPEYEPGGDQNARRDHADQNGDLPASRRFGFAGGNERGGVPPELPG